MRILQTIAIVLAMLGSACGGESQPSAAPTPSPVSSCQTDRTGTVSFKNNTGFTVDMLWNGAVITTDIEPGKTSDGYPVVADGRQYAFDFRITTTTLQPCKTLLVTPLQCQNNTYGTCEFR